MGSGTAVTALFNSDVAMTASAASGAFQRGGGSHDAGGFIKRGSFNLSARLHLHSHPPVFAVPVARLVEVVLFLLLRSVLFL